MSIWVYRGFIKFHENRLKIDWIDTKKLTFFGTILHRRTDYRLALEIRTKAETVVFNFFRLSANLIEINRVLYPSKHKPLTH